MGETGGRIIFSLWSHENVNLALLWPSVCWVRFSCDKQVLFLFCRSSLLSYWFCIMCAQLMNECCVVVLMWSYTADTWITEADVPLGQCSDDVERRGSVFYSIGTYKCFILCRKSNAELSVCTLILQSVTASLFLLLAVCWPDFPAGICLAVEPLTCRSRAHFSDLPPDNLTDGVAAIADTVTEVQWKIGCAQIMAVMM